MEETAGSPCKVEIYTWQDCPYCQKAKAILESYAIAYTEHKIDGDEPARTAMARLTGGRRTVPQIFIDGNHIGGCCDLQQFEEQGQLKKYANTAIKPADPQP